jgi:RimJ/RimL family protein N-acetyltransferase
VSGKAPFTLRLAGMRGAAPVEVSAPWRVRTLRMSIRRALPTDRGAFLRSVNVSRAALEEHCPIHRPGEDDAALFDRLLHRDGGDGPGQVSVRLLGVLDDGRVAGGFNLIGLSAGLERKATANWWVASDLIGEGLATEGVAGLLGHALADQPPYGEGLGLHTVEAWITRGHGASVRVAEKTGFRASEAKPSFLRTGDRWVLHDLYVRRVDDPL